MNLFSDLPAPVRGALWMLAASVCYVTAATVARRLGDGYSVFQLTFIRAVVACAFLAPVLARVGRQAFRTQRFRLHLLNGAFIYLGILCWFYAATRMPVADFFALQFTTPLFTIVLAMAVLRERVDPANWIATLVGFAGVLIVLRPGLIEVTLGALATLASSAGYASVNTTIRVLSRGDGATVIVFYTNLLLVPLSLPMTIIGWRTPDVHDSLLIAGVAVLSTVAFLATARAIAVAESRAIQPVNFLRMPLAAALGYVLFGEVADLWTWTGAGVIFASTYYVVLRESRRSSN